MSEESPEPELPNVLSEAARAKFAEDTAALLWRVADSMESGEVSPGDAQRIWDLSGTLHEAVAWIIDLSRDVAALHAVFNNTDPAALAAIIRARFTTEGVMRLVVLLAAGLPDPES